MKVFSNARRADQITPPSRSFLSAASSSPSRSASTASVCSPRRGKVSTGPFGHARHLDRVAHHQHRIAARRAAGPRAACRAPAREDQRTDPRGPCWTGAGGDALRRTGSRQASRLRQVGGPGLDRPDGSRRWCGCAQPSRVAKRSIGAATRGVRAGWRAVRTGARGTRPSTKYPSLALKPAHSAESIPRPPSPPARPSTTGTAPCRSSRPWRRTSPRPRTDPGPCARGGAARTACRSRRTSALPMSPSAPATTTGGGWSFLAARLVEAAHRLDDRRVGGPVDAYGVSSRLTEAGYRDVDQPRVELRQRSSYPRPSRPKRARCENSRPPRRSEGARRRTRSLTLRRAAGRS